LKTKFWIQEKSPKQFFLELVALDQSYTEFWDIINTLETEIESYDFDYPRYTLAFSTTFYGFNNDGGNLSYEEQNECVTSKFNEYKNQISDLIKQNPDEALLPKIDYERLFNNQELESVYWEIIEMNPFMREFEGKFAAWKKNNKVLFLSVTKEDKELPYEISVGGLALEKYTEMLHKFNSIIND